jgi:hypothetical protein
MYRQETGDVRKILYMLYFTVTLVNVFASSYVNLLTMQQNFSSRLMYSEKELVKKK